MSSRFFIFCWVIWGITANIGLSCPDIVVLYKELREKVYCPGGCYQHTRVLLQLMKEFGLGTGNTSVLLLTPADGGRLKPDGGSFRDVPGDGWRYHAILVHDGLVFDPAAKRTEPMQLAEYMTANWLNRGVDVVEVQAAVFLDYPPPEPVSGNRGNRQGQELLEWQANRLHYETWWQEMKLPLAERSVRDYLQSFLGRRDVFASLPPNYLDLPLALKVEAGASEAIAVFDPFSGKEIFPERHLYLRVANESRRQGDFAVAHDIANGQVIQREVLEAVWVPGAERFKIRIGLERFDRNGKKLTDNDETKKEKSRCLGCHGVNPRTGHLYATSADGKPMPDRYIFQIYSENQQSRGLPHGARVAVPDQ